MDTLFANVLKHYQINITKLISYSRRSYKEGIPKAHYDLLQKPKF